jgi:drug/metabolite transporter (DMT)-like permease
MNDSPRIPPNLAIFVSIIAVSTASIFIRISNSPPLAIASYRMLFSTLILFPFFFYSQGPEKIRRIRKRSFLLLVGVGVVLALHFASWITSLKLTTVVSSVLFVHIDPLFVALFSHFFLNESVSRKTMLGIILGIIGVILIGLEDAALGELNLYGDFLALIGGVMLGIYIIGGRTLRKELDLTTYVTPVYFISSIILLGLSLVNDIPLSGYPSREYLLFLIIAIVPMIFGHTVSNWALRYVEAPIISLSLLGEPVGASLLAYIFLDEVPTLTVLIGGAITLFGILITVYRKD